jgi:hypothetical protein
MYFVGALCGVTLYSVSSFERESPLLHNENSPARYRMAIQESRFRGATSEIDAKLKKSL